MKKTLLLGLAIVVSLGATACDKKADTNNTVLKEEKNENNIDYSKIDKESQMLYGKVKSIIGNEIEFEIAKTPEGEIEGVKKEEQPEEEMKGGSVPAVMSTPATEATEDYKVNVGDIEKNEPLVELDFIGEFKTMNIPVGVNINVLSAKDSKGLDAIKEGTYLRFIVDDNKLDNPSIIAVEVIS